MTEDLFRPIRTNVRQGGLRWEQHWRIVDAARDIYGPWHVNCHTLVGLGETDRDLMAIFERQLDRQIHSYLFCFNAEPESRMGTRPKSDLTRWRRIQLAKFLLEETIADGYAFMTNGCPSADGEPGCTRPMGSWRPSDEPRDYSWQPTESDALEIRGQLRLAEILRPGPSPTRSPELCAPPVAGRPAAGVQAKHR